MKNKCLIYPILQKYYSALNNLIELNIAGDIFYDISKIDAFFAEFRNITFVMQKVFNTKELKNYYEAKRNEILLNEDMKWFVDQRNKITKQEPFRLEKGIRVDVYSPDFSTTIIDDRLTIDNNVNFETILSDLKEILLSYKNYIDVFFSITLSYRENGNEIDIYERIKNGIVIMNKFILSIINDYPCSCTKCTQLKNKIDEHFNEVLYKEISFIWDCSIEKDEVVFGELATMMMGANDSCLIPIDEIRTSLKGSHYEPEDGQISTLFQKFASMHFIIYKLQNKNIMPTFMLLFDDDTFSHIPFIVTVKTTLYRMTSKIAKITREKNVIAVFFVGEFYSYSLDSIDKFKQIQREYNERIGMSETTFLTCNMIYKNYPSILSIHIDNSKLEDENYVAEQIRSIESTCLFSWLQPIYQSLHSFD